MKDIESYKNKYVLRFVSSVDSVDYQYAGFELSYVDENGETVTRTKHILVLFDVNGKSYLTGSQMCYRAFSDITSINGLPSKENHVKFKPINISAEEKGHNFLSLVVVD